MRDPSRDLDIADKLTGKPGPKALSLDAYTGEGFAADTDLSARCIRGASTVDACSSGSGRQTHHTLLVALSVHARMLLEDWIAATQRTKGLAGLITTHDAVVVAGLGKALNTIVMYAAPSHPGVVPALAQYPRIRC
jgi:hypothetical protein